MDRGKRCGMALHRARQAAAEWLHGELQWEAPRRMPERARVLFARRSPQADRSLAHRLQRRTPALEPRLSDPQRVRRELARYALAQPPARRIVPDGNGPDRCGMWGLRAPARCRSARRWAK